MNTNKPMIIARLTAVRSDGMRTIVEVHADATFSQFFEWSTQQGRRWSTKKHMRFSSRNDGLPNVNAHRHTPGLEALQTKLESLTLVKFTSITIQIFKKRAYNRLINAAPDVLGLAKVHTVDLSLRKAFAVRLPSRKAIPVGKWLNSLELKQVTQ